MSTPHDHLYTPGKDRAPDVHTLDLALRIARESLTTCGAKDVHTHGQMLSAAAELHFVLLQLVIAIEAERGERR